MSPSPEARSAVAAQKRLHHLISRYASSASSSQISSKTDQAGKPPHRRQDRRSLYNNRCGKFSPSRSATHIVAGVIDEIPHSARSTWQDSRSLAAEFGVLPIAPSLSPASRRPKADRLNASSVPLNHPIQAGLPAGDRAPFAATALRQFHQRANPLSGGAQVLAVSSGCWQSNFRRPGRLPARRVNDPVKTSIVATTPAPRRARPRRCSVIVCPASDRSDQAEMGVWGPKILTAPASSLDCQTTTAVGRRSGIRRSSCRQMNRPLMTKSANGVGRGRCSIPAATGHRSQEIFR